MDNLIKRLYEERFSKPSSVYFDVEGIQQFGSSLPQLLFPQRNGRVFGTEDEFAGFALGVKNNLCRILKNLRVGDDHDFDREEICRRFFSRLWEVQEMLDQDAMAIYHADPAARSKDEVIISYLGFFAICLYRFAHLFHQLEIPILPRILSAHAHQVTGIEIHPAAKIGRHFCIDHGTGVVIGETTEIGEHVKIYQGVTLGALSVDKALQGTKRHPTIEDRVVIYSNATILGGDTVLGEGSVIGGNVFITKSVPKNALVYHLSEIRMKTPGEESQF